ncbi:hypothetical protein GCM10008018_36520 [Paenibacillus marchantiophytorum]|uniref:Uncharacterized protein n=1 Tax=Paenibacillus marchantiophytorum TaxID=1619310 RepID=A0ABQ1EVB7_9BACL|nr:hypothetical protein [Paenibacillus marchantiophytorum]GFZ87041.1 hypothetical protein GCM10008018_36520 [Paenibacillus marchantiophytorum]
MSNILEIHEQFVLEEDQLVKQINTCNEITATILDLMYQQAQSLHTLTVEEVLMSIHRIQQDLQTELLHARLEKTVMAYKHSHGLPQDDVSI